MKIMVIFIWQWNYAAMRRIGLAAEVYRFLQESVKTLASRKRVWNQPECGLVSKETRGGHNFATLRA
jgi:hypothetical protein